MPLASWLEIFICITTLKHILLTFNTYGRGRSHDLFHQEVVHHWILSKGNVNDDTEKWLTIFHKYKRHLLLRICFRLTVGNTLRGDILTLVCLYERLSSNMDKMAPKLSWHLRDCSNCALKTKVRFKVITWGIGPRPRAYIVLPKDTPYGSTARNYWEEHISTLSAVPLPCPVSTIYPD